MKFSKKNFSNAVHERTNNLINPDTTEVVISIICNELINYILSGNQVIIEGLGEIKLSVDSKDITSIKFNTHPTFKKKIASRINRRKILDKLNQ